MSPRRQKELAMALANREPLSSSSSIQGEERGSVNVSSKEPLPFPGMEEEEEELVWAHDLDGLRQRLGAALGLHPVDIERALRCYAPSVVEGAALKTLHLSNRGVVRRSLEGFFFTTLRRGLGWTPGETRAYLEAEAGKERCSDCPAVGVCPACGRGEAGKWRG